nr:PREDICTED: 28 kDa heat- and acid-stable phosphoprotein [Opisthocomus hoazin]
MGYVSKDSCNVSNKSKCSRFYPELLSSRFAQAVPPAAELVTLLLPLRRAVDVNDIDPLFGLLGCQACRKGGHKGRARQYTSPEEIDAQLQAEKQKAREEEEQEEGGEGATGDPKKEKKSLDSDESDEDDDDYQQKRKGVEGLIDIENPNRVIQTTKKVTQLDLDGPKELSRREREEIEKQKAKERYMKMHLAGKTEQAKADLARLAIIRKQREEAARKKEEERKAKDEAAMAGKRLQSLSLNK